MAKYGRPLRFGCCLLPTVADDTGPLQLAALAERLGLDYVGIEEHSHEAANYDSWTLLSAIGASTSRISLFATLDDLTLRPSAVIAKAAASLDVLTNGRVNVALGAGTSLDQLLSNGEKQSDTEALAALEEAIQVMRLMWSGDPSVRFEGKFHQLAGLEPGPQPVGQIGIWLGVNDPQAARLVGRLADGWIVDHYPGMQPDDLARLNKQVDDAALAACRSPSAVQRIWKIRGTIGNEEDSVTLQGSAKEWAEWLAELAMEGGIDTFLLMEGENAEEQLRTFAGDVVPRVREMVEVAPGVLVTSGLARAIEGASASGATPAEEETDNVDWVDETSMESFPASDPPASSSFT